MSQSSRQSRGGAGRAAGTPELKPGKALDLLTEKVENWAQSYRRLDEPERWGTDFESKFQRDAASLAGRCSQAARRFEGRDWGLAIALWLAIGVVVWVFSVFVMQLDGSWPIIFGVFAALIAAVGIWQSYVETTSEKRAADKLAKHEQWLLGVTRKNATKILTERAAARGAAR
ncbi:MAG: hypothetical protein ACTH31_05110 [Pseudoclavibacter sp.]